ncbi:MAG: hypothetical protein OEY06_06750 [Gammaproteobacteria bacterium]|nr:hypothetical protein [Gammaproteobacteria bacterium]
MRTMNYKLMAFIMTASILNFGCAGDDVLSASGSNQNSGVVSQKNFNISASDIAPEVFNGSSFTYAEVTITASIGDRYNQTLTDSHTIYFATEYGLIDPSCITINGTCEVTWKTSGTTGFPANDIAGPAVGSPGNTIIAYTFGEESFTDLNGNGFYDDPDGGFIDLQEPYIDVGNNGFYDILTDIVIDTVNGNDLSGNNAQHDYNDSFFNGPGCLHSVNCSLTVASAMVWDTTLLKLDGGTVATFNVGGNVAGLTGTVELQNNGGDTLAVSANGAFTFATPIDNLTSHNVTILTQPAGQTCSVTGGNGTVDGVDVTNVAVDCVNNYSVGGNIAGLIGTVSLQNNLGDTLAVSANGAFTFATPLPADGLTTYDVTIALADQPAGQNCTVTNPSGTMPAANVTTVAVTCTSFPYTIGGTTVGLAGNLVLQNNGGDNLTVTTNNFTFATPAVTADAYSVTILTQPVGQICSFDSGATGVVVDTNITTVAISCINQLYSVGGIISGATGSMSLAINGNFEVFNLVGTNPFTFATTLPDLTPYTVTVQTPPTGQVCTVTNGTGTISGAPVGNVSISCASNLFTIGGTISGLLDSVTLQNNLGDNLIIGTPGTSAFTFATPIVDGNAYSVTVLTQPAGQNCVVTGGVGTVATANVTGVGVACTNLPFNIGGTVSGLTGSITLQNNGGDDLLLSANAPYSFVTQIDNGSTYNVTILTQPAGQLCSVANPTGTVIGANVTNVNVSCQTLYTVGGTVAGLAGGSVELLNNGGDNLVVSANGGFTFATGLLDTAAYNVTVLNHPAGQTCTVTAPSGNITTANVSNVTVTCVDNTIGGTITGLVGNVTLQNNLGDDLTILGPVATGPFVFATPLNNGATYSVTVLTQPLTAEVCTATVNTGTATAPVTTVAVDCI